MQVLTRSGYPFWLFASAVNVAAFWIHRSAQSSIPAGAAAFTPHRQTGVTDVLGAAWVATGITLYGVLWLLGLRRSFARPDAPVAFYSQLRTILPELPDSIKSNASSN